VFEDGDDGPAHARVVGVGQAGDEKGNFHVMNMVVATPRPVNRAPPEVDMSRVFS
jgi:hypothetical protein